MSVAPDISTLRCWLKDVLGEEPPDWEVITSTQHILEELYLTHQRQEASAALELEELQEARAEYQAETARLSHILSKLGGLEEQMSSGLAGSYLNTLSEVAFTLNLDLAPGSTTCAASMQAALAKLLIKQAELGPKVGMARAEVEKGELDMLELHARLARLEELCEQAEAEGRAGEQASSGQKKKTEFTLAKVEQYQRDIERGEASLVRSGGADTKLRHSEAVRLRRKVEEVQNQVDPLQRELGGFLNLPPSIEMSRVEVAGKKQELEKLEREIESKISSLHV